MLRLAAQDGASQTLAIIQRARPQSTMVWTGVSFRESRQCRAWQKCVDL